MITDLIDDSALFSLEHQLHLSEVVGDHSWNVTLSELKFTFTGATPRTCTAMHLLGSAAPGPQTWLWAWANPSGFRPEAVALAASVRDWGRQHGEALLTEPEIPFDALPGGPTDPNLAAGMLIEASKRLTGRWTSYTGDAGGGTRAAFLIEHPDFVLPPPEGPRLMRILSQGTAEIPLHDHRRALLSYASLRGLATSEADGKLSLRGNGFTAEIEFDRPHGRVSSISGSISGS